MITETEFKKQWDKGLTLGEISKKLGISINYAQELMYKVTRGD